MINKGLETQGNSTFNATSSFMRLNQSSSICLVSLSQ